MTFSSRPTKAKCSRPICPIAPGIRDRSPARRDWCRRAGTPAQDQWGAIQMQNRFMKLNSRRMTALDMQAWTAARMIGEATSRTNSGDPKAVFDFLKGPDFSVAAFKGTAADAARLEPAASPADPAGRRPHGRLGFAAGRFPASGLGTRYARRRSARNQMQAALKQALLEKERSRMWRRCLLVWNGRVACRCGARFGFHGLCVEREEQYRIRHRYRQLDRDQDHQGRPAAARHRIHAGRQVRDGRGRRRRHHPGDRRQDAGGGGHPALRPRPRTVRPGCRRQDRSMSPTRTTTR